MCSLLLGVALVIEQGGFTALVGPSDSVKMTMLNLIGGLDRPTEETVAVGGQDISTLSDNLLIDFRKENIGSVFEADNKSA